MFCQSNLRLFTAVEATVAVSCTLASCTRSGGSGPSGEQDSAIVVIKSELRPITARDVFHGTNAIFDVRLKAAPNCYPVSWNNSAKLFAGARLLGESDPNGPLRNAPFSRRISSDNATEPRIYGGFDLSTIPAEAGEVTVVWNAELKYRRQGDSSPEPRTSTSGGRFVLRPAGKASPMPKVSKNPHLKIRRVEILPLQKGNFASEFVHPIKLHLERDKEFVRSLTAEELQNAAISYTYKTIAGPTTRTDIPDNSVSSTFSGIPVTTATAMSKEFLLPVETLQYHRYEEIPGGALLEFNLFQASGWPLRFTVPFARADGSVITGDARPTLITDGKPDAR